MDHYEIRDVPRERWLYPDRCMAKWLGWLLSDHTAYLSEKRKDEQPTPLLPEMAAADIDARMQQAWEKSQPVTLQLIPEYDNNQAPMITGAIVGFAAGQITIMQHTTGNLVRIATDQIRHVDFTDTAHWWAA